jgi:hypothetical protein
MAPRTQKITLRSRQCSVCTAGWRAVARCHGQRDAVPDDDLVVADEVRSTDWSTIACSSALSACSRRRKFGMRSRTLGVTVRRGA